MFSTNVARSIRLPDQWVADGDLQQPAKLLYQSLSQNQPSTEVLDTAAQYLRQQIAAAAQLTVDLPASLEAMQGWFDNQLQQVGTAYQDYLAARKAGAPRRYFSTRAHALYFLQVAAPTKLVDGAWLAALLPRWSDPDFASLIRIYLEELGDGVAEKNHVALYRKLITTHGCDQFSGLDDAYFVQGATQLALAHCGTDFLPELIGFNLGYEQLPLHLLITAYELNELDIDPYYFTLHVTIDNAVTGHAAAALQAVRQQAPSLDDGKNYWHRVMQGFRLNQLGHSTETLIASYQPETELIRILQSKCLVGKNMHSDYCRVGGKTINSWLAEPDQIGAMLQQLERAGWFVRGAAPEQSRFWRLVQGEKAEMFGVFSAYEQAVLADWILTGTPALAANDAGDQINDATDQLKQNLPAVQTGAAPARSLSYRARQRAQAQSDVSVVPGKRPPRAFLRVHRADESAAEIGNPALRGLEQRVAALHSKDEVMTLLASLMSPALHHSATGLMATRLYAQLLRS